MDNMGRRWLQISLVASLVVALPLVAQRVPRRPPLPVDVPTGIPMPRPGPELPWPGGLGKKEALTGHIAAIDKDQMLVRSLDYGEALFWVDERTVVRVDNYRLSLTDLRVGDPVAVRLKNIKGRGPYATEILPHPDVRARKERGESPPPAPAPSSSHGTYIPPDTPARPTPEATPAAAASSEPADDFPALPPGATGVVGTVTTAVGESLELRDAKNQPAKVLITGITRIKRAGTDSVLPAVQPGDRVAVAGDRLDSGEWIAREIWVQSARSTAQGARPVPGQAERRRAEETEPASRDGLARFSGVIASLGKEEVRIRTATGERTVIITGVTEVRRMGVRTNFAALKSGDEVRVVGDLLEGGVVLARELTVTKLAGS